MMAPAGRVKTQVNPDQHSYHLITLYHRSVGAGPCKQGTPRTTRRNLPDVEIGSQCGGVDVDLQLSHPDEPPMPLTAKRGFAQTLRPATMGRFILIFNPLAFLASNR